MTYRVAAVIEKDADGYIAYCPELQGCCTSGETYEEALPSPRDAVRLHIEDRLECGEAVPVGILDRVQHETGE